VSDGSPPAGTERSRAKIGRYEILKLVADADREMVYLGIDPLSESEVVIRVSRETIPEPLSDRAAADGGLARGLVHRNLLRVFDMGEDNELAYQVEEVLRGQTLAETPKDRIEALDLATRVDMVAQLCSGLHVLHQHGVIHGDVKPANVFRTSEGVIKLLNTRVTPAAEMTIVSDNALSGSFEYSSPERLRGDTDVDGRSDVFSAAVLLYELVSGRLPFHGASTIETVSRIIDSDPAPLEQMPALDALVRRGLEKNPDKRFQSAQEFAYALWLHISGVELDDADENAEVNTLYRDRVGVIDAKKTEWISEWSRNFLQFAQETLRDAARRWQRWWPRQR
jgi:serine/threonine-protein kinase